MQLATAEQMRELDRRTIEEVGVPGMVLMENAGRGTVDCMIEHIGPVTGRTVVIFVGPGNNGGDGLVIARTLLNLGCNPQVFFLLNPAELGGDAGLNYSIFKKLGIAAHILKPGNIEQQIESVLSEHSLAAPIHSLVDSIFGTGLARNVEGHWLETIHTVNSLRSRYNWPTVAVDIPSGLNSDTGQPLGGAVTADLTVTYGLPKPGHFHNGGPNIGALRVVDIGIPPQVREQAGLGGSILDASSVDFLLDRPIDAHKGTSGHLLVIAGSTGKTGAAILSAKGALYSGSGLVTLGVPGQLNPVFETTLPEAMTVPLSHASTELDSRDFPLLMELAKGKQALVIGPGIGQGERTSELVLKLYAEVKQPMVIDADALNILAENQQLIAAPAGPRIFTPHPGEMSRLISVSPVKIQADRNQAIRLFQANIRQPAFPMITVLKGAGTLISEQTGKWTINTSGNQGMATGGMGDVLSGLIGGMLTQGHSPWRASCLGVYLHGAAADIVAQTKPFGYTAGEVAERIPQAISEFLNREE